MQAFLYRLHLLNVIISKVTPRGKYESGEPILNAFSDLLLDAQAGRAVQRECQTLR